jgi:phosphatidylserine/phosphatidylglycerophosphate/cardiolipin synthase-like enzyme
MRPWIAACLLAIASCAVDSVDDGDYSANPSDFDSKADGVTGSSAAVIKLIDGAKSRVYLQAPTLADKTLITHLKSAAARNVDVHVYVVVPHAAHPETVLAAEQLEAAGVDTISDRATKLSGFLAIADDTLLVDATGKTDTNADHVQSAADKFNAAIAEDVSGTPPAIGSDGTALILMPDSGPGPIVSLMGGAKSSIDLSIYQLQSPAAVAALVAAQQRGVTVRVMLEPQTVGSVNFPQVNAVLDAAGIACKPTPPKFSAGFTVDHAKFMILDGNELLYSSGNLVRSGLGGNRALEFDNRDFWIRDQRDASVSEAKQLFAADWARTDTTSIDFKSLVLTPDNANDQLDALIDGAKSRLYIYNQSLNDKTMIAKINAAKGRGVDVRVLLADIPAIGSSPAANQAALDAIQGAAYFSAHYLHGKVIVADDQAFVGSQNFTGGGLLHNRELGEILTSKTIVDSLAKHFLADQANPTP